MSMSYNMIGLIKAAGLFTQTQPQPNINAGLVQVPTSAATIPAPIPTSKPVVTAKPVAKLPTKAAVRPGIKQVIKPKVNPKVNLKNRELVKNPFAGEMDADERFYLMDRSDNSSPASRGERY